MIDGLGLLLREGFGLVIASVLPLFVVAAIAAVIVGLLGGALGIRDAALGQIARSLAVVLAGVAVAGSVATSTVEFAAHSWALGEGKDADADMSGDDERASAGQGASVEADDERASAGQGTGAQRP